MTDWNLFPAVTLNTLFFIIGAEPIDLNRTTTGGQLSHRKLKLSSRAGAGGWLQCTLRTLCRVLCPVRVEGVGGDLRQRRG